MEKITFKKKKGSVSLAFFCLGLLVLLIILAKIFSFLSSLDEPFSKELTPPHKVSWDGKSAINVLFASNISDIEPQLSLVSFHPKEEKILILNLPNDIYSQLPKEYGSWRLGSIYKLGQEENPKVGPSLLKLSLAQVLGLPVDGVFLFAEQKDQKPTENLISDIRKNPFSFLFLMDQLKTDMSFSEAARFSWALKSVRGDKVSVIDMERSVVTESKLLPDSTRVLGVNTIKMDLFIRDKMADLSILDEGISVAVYNATDHPGLAQEAARLITNLGGNVVTTSSLESKQTTSSIILTNTGGDDKELKKEVTYNRLAAYFAPDCLKIVCSLSDTRITSSRAQINVVIGEDYYNFWYKR